MSRTRLMAINIPESGAHYEAEIADSALSRSRGLLGRRGLAPGTALLIRPSNSIHTMFMRFAIDVVYLDRDDIVVKVVRGMKPNRFSWGTLKAKTVIELASGAAPPEIRPGIKVALNPLT